MKYTKEVLEEAVKASTSMAGVLRYFNKTSSSLHTHLSKKVKEYGIDTSHFTGQGWSKGRTFEAKDPEAYLRIFDQHEPLPKSNVLRKALRASGVADRCSAENCPVENTWLGKPISLHVDHVSGDRRDNRLRNLRFLCPNCHGQTETWGPQRTEKRVCACGGEKQARSKECARCRKTRHHAT